MTNTSRLIRLYIIFILLQGVMIVFPISSFAKNAPVILYTDIISGPNTGGEDNKGCYLSIFGFNFGTPVENLPPTTTHVYINGIEVGAYKYLGPSLGRPDVQQLSVQVGTGTIPNVSTGAIKVTVLGQASNIDHTFTVRSGDIYYIDPSGNDLTGVGSFSNPFKTARRAYYLGDFGAGDFIVLKPGTYMMGGGRISYHRKWWWIYSLHLE